MKVTILQHAAFEKPGLITDWINMNGYETQTIKIFEQHPLPVAAEIEFLIVLGGPMSVNDSTKWITAERKLIEQVVVTNKPMLGICLGAQQLAATFGGQIKPSPKEVGFGSIEATMTAMQVLDAPRNCDVLHWHSEGFTLPVQAIPLFKSELWPNQGFQFLNAIGLQFHLEATPSTVTDLLAADAQFLKGSALEADENRVTQHLIDDNARQLLFNILDYLTNDEHLN